MARKYGSPLLLSVLAILMAQASAQSQSTPSAATAPAKFDVASIRPSGDQESSWMGTRMTGGTFEAHRMSLHSLVWFAYANDSQRQQMVSGAKGWIDSENWDIMAKVDDPSLVGLSNKERMNRMRPMVQALLEERFHLKLHTELRPTPVYVLMQAKGGAKVKEVPAPPEVNANGDWMEAMKHYQEENPGKPFPGSIMCTGDRCTATAMPISNVAGQIGASIHADRPVIDETGLKGYYDLSFRTPGNDDNDAMGEIEDDLGMKLEARKMDLTTYVIDSADKPSDN